MQSRMRSMSEAEREVLRQRLKQVPNTFTRWIRGATNALIIWAILMLLFVLVWKCIAWLALKIFRIEIGWHSTGAIWIVALGIFACAIYAIISSIKWVQKWPDARTAYQADLEARQVVEESYEFIAAKCFQEPEHGGLIYFLRTTANKVFVLYDYESQNLGTEGENPRNSKFRPMSEMLIIRAPKSELVVSKQFSGTVLDAEEPQELSVGPNSWPEDEAFCKIRWEDLEKRLSRKTKSK